jgi:hypothetical protein
MKQPFQDLFFISLRACLLNLTNCRQKEVETQSNSLCRKAYTVETFYFHVMRTRRTAIAEHL